MAAPGTTSDIDAVSRPRLHRGLRVLGTLLITLSAITPASSVFIIAPGVIVFVLLAALTSDGSAGEFGHPVWLLNYIFVFYLFGAIIAFPVYFYRKDARRRAKEPDKAPRAN